MKIYAFHDSYIALIIKIEGRFGFAKCPSMYL